MEKGNNSNSHSNSIVFFKSKGKSKEITVLLLFINRLFFFNQLYLHQLLSDLDKKRRNKEYGRYSIIIWYISARIQILRAHKMKRKIE